MAHEGGKHNSNTDARRDIWFLGIIAMLIVGGTIFISFKILDQSERHLETIKEMKVTENVDNAWAPQSAQCDNSVKADLEADPNRTQAKYANLQISETSMTYIARMRNLRRLDLARCSLNDDWLIHLKNLPLESLSLSDCDITNDGMQHLAKIRTLKLIHLNGCNSIGDEGVKKLAELPLAELHLARTSITNSGIKHLTACKSLLKLDVSRSKVTSSALVDLASMHGLRSLDFSGIPVKTNDLSCFLKGPSQLWVLNVSRCGIQDDGVKVFAALPLLRKLNISHNPFTSKGVSYLCSNESIISLRLDGCPNISPADVQKLKKSKPNCRVELANLKQKDLRDTISEFF